MKTIYSIDVACDGDQEQVVSEYLLDEDGNQIDVRRHDAEFDLADATFTMQQCEIPFEVGSLEHVRLTHVGIEVDHEHYDLEVVPE